MHRYTRPWLGRVFIVTQFGQRPHYIAPDDKRVHVVDLRSLLTQVEAADILPTFNFHVIESFVHRIPGLSSEFFYSHNDIMIGRDLQPSFFLASAGDKGDMYVQSLLSWLTIPEIIVSQPSTEFTIHLLVMVSDFLNSSYMSFTGHPLPDACRPFEDRPEGDPGHKAKRIPADWTLLVKPDCQDTPFYWDRMVAAHVFRISIFQAPSHVPRRWEVSRLHALEARLGDFLVRSRLNKFSDPKTDITWPLQVDAAMREVAALTRFPARPFYVLDRTTLNWISYASLRRCLVFLLLFQIYHARAFSSFYFRKPFL
jgi:hypothetical protein